VEANHYIYAKNSAPIVIESHKLVFFAVPKVGCTVWKTLFRRMMGYPDWKARLPHDSKTNGLVYLSHYNTSRATEIMNDPSYTKAIFLRDPKERFLSAYLDKVVRSKRRGIDALCCHKNKSCMREAQTFSGFLNATQRVCSKNVHWLPQSQRMEHQFLDKINFSGHMETVQHDAKQLLEQIGAWEAFEAAGWGPPSGVIFEGKTVGNDHSTSNGAEDSWSRLSKYYTRRAGVTRRSDLQGRLRDANIQSDSEKDHFFDETECELAYSQYRFRELLTIKSNKIPVLCPHPNQGVVNQSNLKHGYRKSAKPPTSSPRRSYQAQEPMIRIWSRHHP
jgi:hypothetical protein